MELKTKTILVADDENDILEIVSYNLLKEGYNVYTARDGNEAFEKAKVIEPPLIILLTALSDEGSHVKGLDSGADDYITKPISTKVLMSRVNALFRRIQKEDNHVLNVGDITIDSSKYSVQVSGNPISLAKKEFELLHL